MRRTRGLGDAKGEKESILYSSRKGRQRTVNGSRLKVDRKETLLPNQKPS